jgi:polar amino acid transport system permease protein
MLEGFLARLAAYWESIAAYMPSFLEASWVVMEITVLVILLSWLCGLLAAFGKTARNPLLRWSASFYIWFIRGTPTLIQIFIVYFGLPQIGMRLSPFTAGVIALGVNSGAYVAEIVRAGLLAIPKGQLESALALGMSWPQAMARIIMPQVVRIIVPPITNEAVSTLKNTSLLSTITVVELTLQAQIVIAATYRPFDFYIIAAVLYLVMTTILTQLSTWVERRYRVQY